MQLKLRVALGFAIGLVAMTGASSAQGATSSPHITIQNATLLSENEILVTGTSNCDQVLFPSAQVAEDSGAQGTGFTSTSTGSSNWAVKVQRTGFFQFAKGKANVTAQANCHVGQTTTTLSDTRTLLVN